MSDKYVIAYCTPNKNTSGYALWYYVGKKIQSSDWDTYGSQPGVTLQKSVHLSDAKVFNTKGSASAAHDDPHVRSDISFVKDVTEKELFNAKLKGE